MTSQPQDLRMVAFTCPTCGQDKCHIVFSHPFHLKSVGAILGFTHPGKDGKNDPAGFIECGLTADLMKVKAIDNCIAHGQSIPKEVMTGVVRGKAKS